MTSFRLRLGIIIGIALGFVLYIFYFSAPLSFPAKSLLHVHNGESGKEIARDLKTHHAIRSQILLEILMRLNGTDTHIIAGTYYFASAENIFTIAWRLHIGEFGLDPIRVVIPEGTDTVHIQQILSVDVPGFDAAAFLTLAKPKEGYLFPDTYFLYPGEGVDEMVNAMGANFNAHVAELSVKQAVTLSGKSLQELIIMGSLLEKEAPNTKDRQIISGILWKRISVGMPLQVDAVFPYITGKASGDITYADLQIRSPYNTYLNVGLPPGPITNPGLDSIVAAATPVASSYLYYLSDKKGNFHYSATYAGQLANEKKYLP